MKITDIKIIHKVLPYKQMFQLSLGNLHQADVCFIIVDTDEGLTGIGYAPGSAPMVAGEIPQGIDGIIMNVFKPLLVGEDPNDIERLLYKIDKAALHNSRAKSGIDFALHDLIARKLGIPIYQLLGGKFRSKIPVMRMVSMRKPEEMAQDSVKLVKEGYRYLKLKVGSDPALDITRFRTVQEAIKDATEENVTVIVDVNQAYDAKTAIKTVNEMGRFGLGLVEQPVPWFDHKGLALVRKNVDVPIEADESAKSIYDVLRLIEEEAVDFISIKPIEIGGLIASKKVAAICEAANINHLVGGTPGSRYIDAFNSHFIASARMIHFGCEIGEFMRIKSDPASGFDVQNGFITVPEGIGIGINVDLEM